MKDCILIVALTAVLATFFLGALYGPVFLMCGPADEMKAAADVEPAKMAMVLFAPISLASATLPSFALVGFQALRQPAATSPSTVFFSAVLLC